MTHTLRLQSSFCLGLAAVLLALAGLGCAPRYAPAIEAALDRAGENRHELEKALAHYSEKDEPLKRCAAEFLIENMPGHSYVVAGLYDKDKNEIEFDALQYANFKEALAALEALEKEHGEIDYAKKRLDEDVKTITADYLIENIDLAFDAWQHKPWAEDMSFETFCEHILPYRGSNEPLNRWRAACMKRYADLPGKMKNVADMHEAADLIRRDVEGWVRFDEIYYLHPTDQGFDEMTARGKGRCEDISNMMAYAMRANAVVCANDYTPFWADRDNNHAWEVVLDANGHGKSRLWNRAAKVYRKMFSVQHESLGYLKRDDEKVPRWLSGKNYIDVTDQYMDTTDVTVTLRDVQPNERFVYLCVFNGGQWEAIGWAWIKGDHATFEKVGRNIVVLPAYYRDETLVPAGDPIIVAKDGGTVTLSPSKDEHLSIDQSITTPETPDEDKQTTKPQIPVKSGKTYELFVWRDGVWSSLGKQTAGDDPVSFGEVPAGGLYWLVEEGSKKLERPFTIEEGQQVWW